MSIPKTIIIRNLWDSGRLRRGQASTATGPPGKPNRRPKDQVRRTEVFETPTRRGSHIASPPSSLDLSSVRGDAPGWTLPGAPTRTVTSRPWRTARPASGRWRRRPACRRPWPGSPWLPPGRCLRRRRRPAWRSSGFRPPPRFRERREDKQGRDRSNPKTCHSPWASLGRRARRLQRSRPQAPALHQTARQRHARRDSMDRVTGPLAESPTFAERIPTSGVSRDSTNPTPPRSAPPAAEDAG